MSYRFHPCIWLVVATCLSLTSPLKAAPALEVLANLDSPPKSPSKGALALAPDGYLYGVTSAGGGKGTIYKVRPDGSDWLKVHDFSSADGYSVPEELVSDGTGMLWGVATTGGTHSAGGIFRFNTATNVGGLIHSLNNGASAFEGSDPTGRLFYDGSGLMWGTASRGGDGYGTLFSINITTTDFTRVLKIPSGFGYAPGGLTMDGSGRFWGTLTSGGASNAGQLFRWSSFGGFASVFDFTGTTGSRKGSSGRPCYFDGAVTMWGVTAAGGTSNNGTIFKINTSTNAFVTVVEFTGTSGANKGSSPWGSLVSDGSGYLWGTTLTGGAGDQGTVFKIDQSTGVMTTVFEYGNTSLADPGSSPIAGLFSDGTGSLWGTTNQGGIARNGTVFKIASSTGTLTKLTEFTGGGLSGHLGYAPANSLAGDGAGFVWGTTEKGGIFTYGTVFKMQQWTNALTSVVEFTGNGATNRGATPKCALVADGLGYMWGSTYAGGQNGLGTIFKINVSTGVLTTMLDFSNDGSTDWGANPVAGMIRDSAGVLWGTTEHGGSTNNGTVFKINPTTGLLTTIRHFTDVGANPVAPLAIDASGNLWGTTVGGGTNGAGTLFRISPSGTVLSQTSFPGTDIYRGYGGVVINGSSIWGTMATSPQDFSRGQIFYFDTTSDTLSIIASSNDFWRAGLVRHNSTYWGTSTSGGIYNFNGSTATPYIQFTNTASLANGTHLFASSPGIGALKDAGDGNLYGTTQAGGLGGGGVLYRMRFGPTTNTQAATNIARYSATLNGTVNPNGLASTAAFSYGTSPTALIASTTQSVPSGTTTMAVSAVVTGLLPGTTYYYRQTGTNADAVKTQVGELLSFTTSAAATNSDLSALAISTGSLSPTFASGTTSYDVAVANATAQVTVTPTVAESHATVKVNNVTVASGSGSNIPLMFGTNAIVVAVTAEDSSAKTYTINVTRQVLPNLVVKSPATTVLTSGVSSIDYGSLFMRQTLSKTVLLQNTGSAPLTISNVLTTSGDSASFIVDTSTMTNTVAAGGSTSFTVTFTPTALGNFASSLQIVSDDPAHSTFAIGLTGTSNPSGIVKLSSPTLRVIEGQSIDVPLDRTGGSDGPMTVAINTSAQAHGAFPAAISGTDYSPLTNVLVTFADGETHKTVTLNALADSLDEVSENAAFILSTGTGYSAIDSTQALTNVHILESTDTLPPTVFITSPANGSTKAEGAVTLDCKLTDNKGVKSAEYSVNGSSFTNFPVNTPDAPSTTGSISITCVPGPNTVSVRCRDGLDHISSTVTSTFIYSVKRPLVVSVSSTTAGSVSSGFIGTSSRQLVSKYTITATPKAGYIFGGWSINSTTSTGVTNAALPVPSLTFTMQEGLQLTANFVPNTFGPVAGSYNGLIHADSGTPASQSTEGFINITVTGTGSATVKLTIDGQTLSATGTIDYSGTLRFGTKFESTTLLTRTGKPALALSLQIDLANTGADHKITGSVVQDLHNGTILSSSTTADRAYYNGLTDTTTVPDAYLTVNGTTRSNGIFNAYLKPQSLSSQPAGFTTADYPQGEGYATITITKAGLLSLSGVLADGTAITASAPLSKANACPLFAMLYSKLGFLSGSLELNALDSETDIKCIGMIWSRPYQTTSQYYPYGWPELVKLDLKASTYRAFTNISSLRGPGGAVIQAPNPSGNAKLTVDQGLLTTPFERIVNVLNTDAIVKLPTTDATYTLSITHASGLLSGTFTHSDNTKPTFKGILYQKGAAAGGHGYFLTTSPKVLNHQGQSGIIQLQGH